MRKSILSLVVLSLLPAGALAQVEVGPPPAATLHVEQVSDLSAVGEWTLLYPNHESLRRLDKTLDVPNLPPGQYTLIATPPKGTTATMEFILGDDTLKTETTPQISFELKDTMKANLRITYKLTVSGKVGVNSAPSGVSFTLRGPNDMVIKGITPMEYPLMPIGNYSVMYSPKGCPTPPQKSGQLQQNDRVDFMIQLDCKTLVLDEQKKDEVLTSDVGSKSVTFTDVKTDAWYAPYVATVSKRGLITGYTDTKGNNLGKFGPGDSVNAAQLAKIIHAFLKIDQNAVARAPWNKAAYGQWFTRYYASAEELGWQIYLDPALDPARPMKRGEVMQTVLQAMDIPLHWAKGDTFSDVKRYTPYAAAIETAAAEGIVAGIQDGNSLPSFHPDEAVTRAELSKILITLHEKYLVKKEPWED